MLCSKYAGQRRLNSTCARAYMHVRTLGHTLVCSLCILVFRVIANRLHCTQSWLPFHWWYSNTSPLNSNRYIVFILVKASATLQYRCQVCSTIPWQLPWSQQLSATAAVRCSDVPSSVSATDKQNTGKANSYTAYSWCTRDQTKTKNVHTHNSQIVWQLYQSAQMHVIPGLATHSLISQHLHAFLIFHESPSY